MRKEYVDKIVEMAMGFYEEVKLVHDKELDKVEEIRLIAEPHLLTIEIQEYNLEHMQGLAETTLKLQIPAKEIVKK